MRAALLLASLPAALGTASGYDRWTCVPSAHNTKATPTSGGYALRLLDGTTDVTTVGFTPGNTYTVEQYSVGTDKFTGTIIYPFSGASTTCPTSCTGALGTLSLLTGTSNLRAMSNCAAGLTQTSKTASTSYKMTWVAPASATGPVTFWAITVVRKACLPLRARPCSRARPHPPRQPTTPPSFRRLTTSTSPSIRR